MNDLTTTKLFARRFWTPFEEQKSLIGKKFRVVGRHTGPLVDSGDHPPYRIRFRNKVEIDAFTEEVEVDAQERCWRANVAVQKDRPPPQGIIA